MALSFGVTVLPDPPYQRMIELMQLAERHGFEYYRHGTLSLYAALETATGRVHGKTTARHTSLRISWPSSKTLWLNAQPDSRFTSFSIISPRTRPDWSTNSFVALVTTV